MAVLDGRPKAEAAHRRSGTAVLAKGQARSAAILDAATAVLVEEGAAQLSTRRIAARAGVHPGNVQYYYRTKADIVRALLQRYLAASVRDIEARLAASGGSPAARLQATLDGILDDQADGAGCRMFWEIWALAARDAAVARATAEFYARYRRGVADALRAVTPRLTPLRAERRAALLVAMLEGLTVWRFGGRRRERLDAGVARELRAVVAHFSQEDR
jgi:AcrR family transcriptional regulator